MATRDEDAQRALQLGWGFGCYRFDRYKANKRAPARLVADAFDAEALDLLAACVQVRDLVNTPTEHMGPDELGGRHAARWPSGMARGSRWWRATTCWRATTRRSTRSAAPRIARRGSSNSRGATRASACRALRQGRVLRHRRLDLKGRRRHAQHEEGHGRAHALALAGLVMARALPLRITLLIAAVENAVGPNAFRPAR